MSVLSTLSEITANFVIKQECIVQSCQLKVNHQNQGCKVILIKEKQR